MPQNISGYGLHLHLKASITAPLGFSITQLADDTDPLDIAPINIGDAAMSINGLLVTWATATPTGINISVVPGSEDDTNLGSVFNANRPGLGKLSVHDTIILTINYPNGRVANATAGVIISGPPLISVASAGRMKSNTYGFMFENYIET